MEIQALREKLVRVYDTRDPDSKMTPMHGSHWNMRNYCFEPFSKRTTTTTIDELVFKLRAVYKKDLHKKYLSTFFPYYVFPSMVVDLEGNIVLFLHKERIAGTYHWQYNLYVTKDFARTQVQFTTTTTRLFNNVITVEVDIKDIFFHFHKQYEFKNISEIVDFKKSFANFAKQQLEEAQLAWQEDHDGHPF